MPIGSMGFDKPADANVSQSRFEAMCGLVLISERLRPRAQINVE
jgi:hypothetical protein